MYTAFEHNLRNITNAASVRSRDIIVEQLPNVSVLKDFSKYATDQPDLQSIIGSQLFGGITWIYANVHHKLKSARTKNT
jgi:hypothetical protein